MDEDDRGKVVYWLIDSASASQTTCTDDEDWAKLYPTAPNLKSDNYYFYYVYLMGKDGKNAVAEDCDSTDWNTCTPNSDMIFQIDGHFLRATRSVSGTTTGGDCTITATLDVTLEDKGTEAEEREKLTFQLEGKDCDAFESQVRQTSKNGFGLRDCVAEESSHANFSHSRDP